MQLNRGVERLHDLARGPGRLTAAFRVDRSLDGSIFAEKALYGSAAVTTNPAKSGRASGSAFRGMRTASRDFTFGTVRPSAVQDRSGNKRLPQSCSLERESGLEAPFPPQAVPSHCMNSSAAYECAGPSVSAPMSVHGKRCGSVSQCRWPLSTHPSRLASEPDFRVGAAVSLDRTAQMNARRPMAKPKLGRKRTRIRAARGQSAPSRRRARHRQSRSAGAPPTIFALVASSTRYRRR